MPRCHFQIFCFFVSLTPFSVVGSLDVLFNLEKTQSKKEIVSAYLRTFSFVFGLSFDPPNIFAFSMKLRFSVAGDDSPSFSLLALRVLRFSASPTWPMVTARGRKTCPLGRGETKGGRLVDDFECSGFEFVFAIGISFFFRNSLSLYPGSFLSMLLLLLVELNDDVLPPDRALHSTKFICFSEKQKRCGSKTR